MKQDYSKPTPAETVDCPVHHMPLKAVRVGSVTTAVCNCPVDPNPYAGRPVWQRIDAAKTGEEGAI